MKYMKEEVYDKYYRQVEAMYHKGYDNKYICSSIPLPEFQVLEMIQKVFALQQIRKENKRAY